MRSCAVTKPTKAIQAIRHCAFGAQRRSVAMKAGSGDLRSESFEKAAFGENFGARDIRQGEIETNFGDKVIMNWNTEHIIKPPDAIKSVLGLTARKCSDNEGKLKMLSAEECTLLKNQVPGWKMDKTAAGQDCIRYSWKCKDFVSALKLVNMIGEVAEADNHHPDLHITGYNNVLAELNTHFMGGLTENDFIVAAKVNELDVKELMPKPKARFWA